MMTPRICFLTTNDFGFGGSEDLWIATAHHLLRRGWPVAASVRRWEPTPVVLQRLQAEQCEMLWHQTPCSDDDFARLLEFRPTLVVVSQGFHLEGMDWLQRLEQSRVPFVVVNHCVHEAGWLSMTESVISHMLRLHRAAREFLFVSNGNRNLYERMTGHTLPNAGIVRNPFRVPYDAPRGWPKGATLRLATVGRLECFHKGYDLLFTALSDTRWHSRDMEIHLYGEGPHRPLLERLARRSSFPRVVFHGQTTDVSAIWQHSHALVQPSRLEGLPISVVEAMLCGRPVLATDVAGHAEVISDGETGFLAPAPTPRLLDEALERLWHSRDRLSAMGVAARKAIQAIIPPDPAATFAHRISEHAGAFTGSARSWRVPTARVVDGSLNPHHDHHAHLFFAEDGNFSESQKLSVGFPAQTWVKLRFTDLQGRVRFDPSAQTGVFRVRRLSIQPEGDAAGRRDLAGVAIGEALKISGTASLLSVDEGGMAISSNGEDPIFLLADEMTSGNDSFQLEIELLAE